MDPVYLFVYGTLRRGLDNPWSRFLAREGEWIGRARTPGRLYDLGSYPGMVHPDLPEDWVWGDLYRLQRVQETLPALDEYERCRPRAGGQPEFQRRVAEVTLENGSSVRAWLYLYCGTLDGKHRIDSGDYL